MSALQVKTNASPTMQQQYTWLMLNGKSECRPYCAAKVTTPKHGSGQAAKVSVAKTEFAAKINAARVKQQEDMLLKLCSGAPMWP